MCILLRWVAVWLVSALAGKCYWYEKQGWRHYYQKEGETNMQYLLISVSEPITLQIVDHILQEMYFNFIMILILPCLKDFKIRTLDNNFLPLLFLSSFLWYFLLSCLLSFSYFPSITKPTTRGNCQDSVRRRGKSHWSYLPYIIRNNFISTLIFVIISFFFQVIFFQKPGGENAWPAPMPIPQFVTKRCNFHLRLWI